MPPGAHGRSTRSRSRRSSPVPASRRTPATRRPRSTPTGAAAALQPENPVAWYELGLYEFHLGDRCSAYVHLNRAYTLDPAGTQWTPGSELDQSLAWVNAGNC